MAKIIWTLKKQKVSELKENPKNPRNLTKKGLDDLEKSITKFGVAEPLVVNSDGMICGGHGRKKILERLNIKEVDCYYPSRKLTPKEFDELNVRLNKNIAGEFNFDILANEFELPDLLEWGFEEGELGIEQEPKDLSGKIENTYEVVIECVNEKEQEKIYNELSGKYQCRLLTL
jgi:ParB-like chromosome segregation protein Spo0J